MESPPWTLGHCPGPLRIIGELKVYFSKPSHEKSTPTKGRLLVFFLGNAWCSSAQLLICLDHWVSGKWPSRLLMVNADHIPTSYQLRVWWFRNPANSPVEIGRLSHHLQGFIHPNGGFLARFLVAINSSANFWRCEPSSFSSNMPSSGGWNGHGKLMGNVTAKNRGETRVTPMKFKEWIPSISTFWRLLGRPWKLVTSY